MRFAPLQSEHMQLFSQPEWRAGDKTRRGSNVLSCSPVWDSRSDHFTVCTEGGWKIVHVKDVQEGIPSADAGRSKPIACVCCQRSNRLESELPLKMGEYILNNNKKETILVFFFWRDSCWQLKGSYLSKTFQKKMMAEWPRGEFLTLLKSTRKSADLSSFRGLSQVGPFKTARLAQVQGLSLHSVIKHVIVSWVFFVFLSS